MKKKMKLKMGKLKINVDLAEQYSDCNPDSEQGSEFNEEIKGPEKIGTANNDKMEVFDYRKEAIGIQDNLYIANAATAGDEEILFSSGITHVINLISHTTTDEIDGLKYLNISLRDTPGSDILGGIPPIIEFISFEEAKDTSARFLFHGKKGLSRSVALMTGYLMFKNQLGMKEAIELIKLRRPEIDPNIGFVGQLLTWEEELQKFNNTKDGPAKDVQEWICELTSKINKDKPE